MPALDIRIGGREYRIACDEGQEPRLEALAATIEVRYKQLAAHVKNAPESHMLALLLLTMADEKEDLKSEVEKLRFQLNNVAGSFEKHKVTDMEKLLSNTLNKVAERIEKIVERAGNG